MMQHTIITIGRQFGSGGHEIGNRLAERLDIPLYDHNLIHMAAQELRISNEDATKVDETVLGRFLSAYAAGSLEYRLFVTSDESGKPLTDRVFERQSAIIRKLAESGPGIFVGRCADYILGDYSNCINTFIYAYRDDRVRRIMKLYRLDEKQALDRIKKTDRERKVYYETRTGREWGGIDANSMMFNASLLGIDGVVDALEAIYRKWDSRNI
ncbi:cytidylate kinase-like family protein [Ruminococcus sp. CLA-AA-H200]|uniref:Cytidylate kinase-like family protein n=1 Tax=Ruminococcus turbiniformis TaxID=2881258 RepID=A0ABS8FYV7_9FIRM|nr:cytidylate kinase-like family protein [Ruminococcus turbiniformis]MCC2254794.1 cytidylate kinase-like family protein [Ruminococcus turbiniformis]